MTTSPESKIRTILKQMSLEGGWGWQVSENEEEKLIGLIAAAIREAESDALERAAAWLDEQGPLHRIFREQAATAIRSLKHKD